MLLADHGAPQNPDDLQKLPCVALDSPAHTTIWRFRRPRTGAALDIPLLPRLAVTTTEAAVEAAIRRIGITRLLYYQVAESVRRGALQLILEDYEPEPAPIHLIHAARGQMPLKMRRFLDFAAPVLRQG